MNAPTTHRIRLGAMALGISALLFAAFPIVRPFFPRPTENSAAELTVVSQTLTTPSWVIAHFMAMAALALLLFGLLTLHAHLAKGSGTSRNGSGEHRAFAGLVFGIVGIALILPTLGVETYTMPVLGEAYLSGKADLASIVGRIYGGPDTVVMVLGLLLLAIGAILIAVAIWSSDSLPKWAGIVLAIGLVFWFPLFPQIIRIVDGLLIGIGGLWLAWAIWSRTEGVVLNASMSPDPAPRPG